MNEEIYLDDANPDLEQNDSGRFLKNHTIRNYSWKGLMVTVKDRETKKARDLIHDISGDVKQGSYANVTRMRSMLMFHRGAGSPDGPLGLRQDDAAQRAGSPDRSLAGESPRRHLCEW